MSHNITGLIAKYQPLLEFAKGLSLPKPAALNQGYAFLPVCPYELEDDPDEQPNPTQLGPTRAQVKALSNETPVAYIETDYFGGCGTQSAILYRNGTETMFPVTEDCPISRVLAQLGVAKGEHYDEFEAVGLHLHRDNDEWEQAAEATP